MIGRMRARLVALFCIVLAAGAAACGDSSGADDGLKVVATTTHAADLVRNIGGERVEVEGVLEPGADPHGYEPRPSDAAAAARADLVFRSGGEVDSWLDDLLDNAGGDAEVVELIDSVKTLDDDPHWWQDPRNAILAAGAILESLIRADPQGKAGYERRTRDYVRRLEALDVAVADCMAKIPQGERKLVTTHDSLEYFAHRYDVEVIGSVISSLSTQAQPSAKDVDALVRQVEDENVHAVFPEAGVSERLEAALAREAGAEVGEPLHTDALGDEDSGAATYIEALRTNAAALADGMSGGRVRCAAG